MVLYKATADGQVEMTKEEEAQVRADWSKSEVEKDKPKPKLKSIEDRVLDLEMAVELLSKDK